MKNIIFIITIVCCACSTPVHEKSSDIYGKWCLTTDQINYPEIRFSSDSIAIFSSKMDTTYRYKYYVDDSYLYIIQLNLSTQKNRILQLTRDSLVFESLMEIHQRQVYLKCK